MKYKAIAEQIITDIQSQKLSIGERLPSLRQLTKQLDISMTTALNSYRSLEQMGWVVTHPKSGFFVSTPLSHRDTPELPQFRSSSRLISTKFKSGDYSSYYENGEFASGPFGISQLCPTNIPLKSLKQSIKRTAQFGDQFLHAYSDPQGIYELRGAIADTLYWHWVSFDRPGSLHQRRLYGCDTNSVIGHHQTRRCGCH